MLMFLSMLGLYNYWIQRASRRTPTWEYALTRPTNSILFHLFFFFFFFLQLEGMEDNRVLAGVYFVGSDIKIYVLNACAWEV